MARERSAETKPRDVLRELKRERQKSWEQQNEINTYRLRASKAEAEVKEWKARFDVLLSRTPQLSPGDVA